MYKCMKNLIGRKYYKTAADAMQKIGVFYSMYQLSDDEYIELKILIDTVYGGASEKV